MTLPIGGGNPNARIFIVGEAWGADEARAGKPFVGMSGMELDRMLHEVGIMRSECYVSNVVNAQPAGNDIRAWIPLTKKEITPDCVRLRDRMVKPILLAGYHSLLKEIALVKPTLILALGNTPLWALTGRWGITKWRGSQLVQNAADLTDAVPNPPVKVIPTYHPAAILRQWDWRAVALNDLRRAKRESTSSIYRLPDWTFIIRPSIIQALGTLGALYARCSQGPTLLSFDLETRAGQIACAGIAWDKENAICIPFMAVGQPEGYWPPEKEAMVLSMLHKVLSHSNARVLGQNLLYDCQYTWRHWHFVPRVTFDTMIAHHTAFAAAAGPDDTSLAKHKKGTKKHQGGFKKSLDFQASLYNEHYIYWKDDSKEWDPAIGEEQFWRYNCLTGETLVLNGLSQWTRLDQLAVGEPVLAFDEEQTGTRYSRKLRAAIVTNKVFRQATVIRVSLENGEFLRGTPDHKVFVQTIIGGKWKGSGWKQLQQLQVGDLVLSVGRPWEVVNHFEGGWMAGLLDGEGTIGASYKGDHHFARISFSQKEGAVLEEGKRILLKYGFKVNQASKANAEYVDFKGGLREYLRVLGMFPTKRLMLNFIKGAIQHGWSGFAQLERTKVTKIAPEGIDTVYDITTTAGTFIANGVVVHNCEDAVRTMECAEVLGVRP